MIKERELWVAYLLWFILGLVGVHKFYVNKNWNGHPVHLHRRHFSNRMDYRSFCTPFPGQKI